MTISIEDIMKLTKSSAHAAMAMTYLARQSELGLVQARQVAAQLGIPTDSALKILQALARHDLIRSQLGRAGGYQLESQPDDISLLQIVEAIDGPIHAQIPLHDTCEQLTGCMGILKIAFEETTRIIRAELNRTTLSCLVNEHHHQALQAS